MKGRTINVKLPCFTIDSKTYDLIGQSIFQEKNEVKVLCCETLSVPFSPPKEDEILYLLDGFPNRGCLIKINEQGYEKITLKEQIPVNPDATLIQTTDYKRTPSEKIQNITDSLNRLLQEKNKNYGSSALSPLGVFNKSGSTEGIKVRLDDKLMRVKNSDILRKNDIADIMGYLVLLCVSEEWLDFDELID